MPLSYSTYTGDGDQTSFSITFDYLADTVVAGASPAGILVYLDEVKQTSGYTVNSTTIDFTVAPGSGVAVLLLRSTPRTKAGRLIDFADATVLTEAQLDTSALQLLYIAQEAFEQSESGGGATPTYLPYSDSLSAWDAESQKVSRVAAPAAGTDATNKTYVDDGFLPYSTGDGTYDASRSSTNQKIDGIEDPQGNQQAATKKYVDDVSTWGTAGVPQSWKFTAGGSTNTFTLTGAPYAEAEMLVVGIDGVLQVPVDDYTVTGGATNSSLVLDVTPTDGQIINVLNFGKARFLDSAILEDGSVTTELLADGAVTTIKVADATVTSAKIRAANVTSTELADDAVTTSKIADANVTEAKLATDAVTSDKIADDAVDFARLKDTGFTSSNSESTAKVLRVNAGSANLTEGTLTAADISDFNSTVTGQPLSAFAAATSNVSLGSTGSPNRIVNLADPTSDQDAATKGYVDVSTQSAMKGALITDLSLGTSSGTWSIGSWLDDSKYIRYEMHCKGFKLTDDNALVGFLLKDQGGAYRNSTGNYRTAYTAIAYTGSAASLGAGSSTSESNAFASPRLDSDNAGTNAYESTVDFVVTFHNNHTGGSTASQYKKVTVEGSCIGGGGTAGDGVPGHGSGSAVYYPTDYKTTTWFLYSGALIEGIQFRCIDSATDTSASGSIRAGARVMVYGYEGLS